MVVVVGDVHHVKREGELSRRGKCPGNMPEGGMSYTPKTDTSIAGARYMNSEIVTCICMH